MSSAKGLQNHDLPLVVDGNLRIVKGVTTFTTCDEVIGKLSQDGASLAIFIATSGKEKELSGKTKLLKVWRSRDSSKRAVFVVKQSEGKKTSRRLSLNIFARNRKNSGPASKDKLKEVSDLAFYVQYQKAKLQKMSSIDASSGGKKMHKGNSTSFVDSMDAFLAKTDHQKMGQFLDFCRGVTARHLGETPNAKQSEDKTPRTKLDRTVIEDNLKTTKLGFKKTLTSKLSFVSKTSVSTINSTDTGYQSQNSDMQAATQHGLASFDDIPLHSTPLTHKQNRKHVSAYVTQTSLTAPRFDEVEGKSVLMKRFMNDTTTSEVRKRKANGCDKAVFSSAPVLFGPQEEKCHFYWDQNCDSDSDTYCFDDDSITSDANLDEAFVEYCENVDDDFSEPNSRKLRRDSAVSNLSKFEICAKQFEDTRDDKTNNTGFDYSFDCSFPGFSETQDFSVESSCRETENDFSVSLNEDCFRPVRDSEFYSFMKSRESSVINEKSRYLARDSETQSATGSDEGVGSMTSDSFIADNEILI